MFTVDKVFTVDRMFIVDKMFTVDKMTQERFTDISIINSVRI